MSEIVLELGVDGAAKEAAFVQAVDRFARWRQANAGAGWAERDAPDLMVKTVCAPDGSLNKAITFQEPVWASTFLDFWRSELNENQ